MTDGHDSHSVHAFWHGHLATATPRRSVQLGLNTLGPGHVLTTALNRASELPWGGLSNLTAWSGQVLQT